MIGRIRTILAVGLILLPACDLSLNGERPLCRDEPDVADCRADLDAGGGLPVQDASSDDAGGPGVAGDSGADFDAGLEPMNVDERSVGGDFACFNGLDDDGNTAFDCAESSCGRVPYCCVGAARAACCVGPGVAFVTDFASCGGPGPTDCGSTPLTAFGAPAPGLDFGGLVPGGDDLGDSGLFLGEPVDTRQARVTLTATIAASMTACAGPRCLDVVALGLAERPTDPHVVRPEVAVYVRPSRKDYALVIAGQVVETAELTTELPRQYSLSVAPDGAVSLIVAGEPVAMAARVTPRAGLTPMLWGRTFEVMAPEVPAYVTRVGVETHGCDMPASLARGASPVVPFAGPSWSGPSASPSVVAHEGARIMAFLHQGAVHLARDDGAGWQLVSGLSSPALVPMANEAFEAPELVRRADRFDLYVTRRAAAGVTTVAMAVGAPGHALSFGSPTDLALPAGATFRSPSVLDDGAVTYLAAVTEHLDDSVIVLLSGGDPAGPFTFVGSSLEESVIVAPGDDLSHFAMDEVDAPELFRGAQGLYRLYYAGRRGTRWSIGAAVSGGVLTTWRDPGQGTAILSGSGGGFDALSVRDPSVVLAAGRLALFYSASDGVQTAIARAEGAAP